MPRGSRRFAFPALPGVLRAEGRAEGVRSATAAGEAGRDVVAATAGEAAGAVELGTIVVRDGAEGCATVLGGLVRWLGADRPTPVVEVEPLPAVRLGDVCVEPVPAVRLADVCVEVVSEPVGDDAGAVAPPSSDVDGPVDPPAGAVGPAPPTDVPEVPLGDPEPVVSAGPLGGVAELGASGTAAVVAGAG